MEWQASAAALTMCTRYISPEDREIEDFWRIDCKKQRRKDWQNLLIVFPLLQATFIRRAVDETDYERELVVGHETQRLEHRAAAAAREEAVKETEARHTARERTGCWGTSIASVWQPAKQPPTWPRSRSCGVAAKRRAP